jgi:hypothetical protein
MAMSRLLALVLLVSGSVLLTPPPAVAAVTISLSASPATYVEGGSTTLRGTARAARLGSVVKLQKLRGTSWVTVGRRTLRDSRRFSFRVSPDRGRHIYRVVKPRQFAQPRAVSPRTVVTVTWRPVISVSATGHVDRGADAWVTTVSGTAPELRGATLAVQRHTGDAWVATGETVAVKTDGTFSHVITGGAKGTRYAAARSGLRLAAWSPTVTVAEELYTPSVAVAVEPVQHIEPNYIPVYHQEQRVTVTTDVPDAPVAVDVYEYDEHNDRWHWWTYRRGTTLADGSFTTVLRNLPEGTRVRAVVAASEDGLRKEATSPEAVTTLTPIPVTVNGPQVDVYDVTRDRGALLQFDVDAGELLTFDFDPQADRTTGVWVSWRLLGPDGTEVPEQQYVRGTHGDVQHLTRFYVPTQTGTHTFVLSSRSTSWPAGEDVRVTISSPKVVPFAFDVTEKVASTRPWQVVDLAMTAEAGQVFSLNPGDIGYNCPTAQVVQNGQVVDRLFDDWPGMEGAWRLPADGAFAVRLWPCARDYWVSGASFIRDGFEHTLSVLRAKTVALPFGNQATRIDLTQGQHAVALLDTTAGKVIRVTEEGWYGVSTGLVEAPDGSVVTRSPWVDGQFQFTATQSGTYRLWSTAAGERSSHITWSATERNN